MDPDVASLLSLEAAQRYQVLALSRRGSTLTIAMVDPTHVIALDELKLMTGLNIQPLVACESQLNDAIKKHFGPTYDTQIKTVFRNLTEPAEDAGKVEVIKQATEEVLRETVG